MLAKEVARLAARGGRAWAARGAMLRPAEARDVYGSGGGASGVMPWKVQGLRGMATAPQAWTTMQTYKDVRDPKQALEAAMAVTGGAFEDHVVERGTRHEVVLAKGEVEAENVVRRLYRESGIGGIARSIEKNFPREGTEVSFYDQVNILRQALMRYFVEPAITSHPTKVESRQAEKRINGFVGALVFIMRARKEGSLTEESFTEHYEVMQENAKWLLTHNILPDVNLTNPEEVERALDCALALHQSLPELEEKVAADAEAVLRPRGKKQTKALKHAVATGVEEQGRHVDAWAPGDGDGNDKVTGGSMADSVKSQQIRALGFYIEQAEELCKLEASKDVLARLEAVKEFWVKSVDAVQRDILFTKEKATRFKDGTCKRLDIMIDGLEEGELKNGLQVLRGHVNRIGYRMTMGAYVRQTTDRYYEAFDDIVRILAPHSPELKAFLGGRSFSELSEGEQEEVTEVLGREPELFSTLVSQRSRWGRSLTDEVARAACQYKHADIFSRKIFSDTKSFVNILMHNTLSALARHERGGLGIGDYSEHMTGKVARMTLHESRPDIERAASILEQRLSNAADRASIVEDGYVRLVGGPSDLTAKAGQMMKISLLDAQVELQEVINRYAKIYPELEGITVKVLDGHGADLKRSSSLLSLHSTLQGEAAWLLLGCPGAAEAYVDQVAGRMSETHVQVLEHKLLQEEHPEVFEALQRARDCAAERFEELRVNPAIAGVIGRLTVPEAARAANTSSRAGSKSAKVKQNVFDERAIGQVNHFLLSGIHADTFMGVLGIGDADSEDRALLGDAFRYSTRFRSVIYESLYAVATSRFSTAWERLGGGDEPRNGMVHKMAASFASGSGGRERDTRHALAYLQNGAEQVLDVIGDVVPGPVGAAIKEVVADGELEVSEKALQIMTVLGRHFEECQGLAEETKAMQERNFSLLDRSIREYVACGDEESLGSVVLALRSLDTAIGPHSIRNLRSPMAFDNEGLLLPWVYTPCLNPLNPMLKVSPAVMGSAFVPCLTPVVEVSYGGPSKGGAVEGDVVVVDLDGVEEGVAYPAFSASYLRGRAAEGLTEEATVTDAEALLEVLRKVRAEEKVSGRAR